jgi:hypothetical protein
MMICIAYCMYAIMSPIAVKGGHCRAQPDDGHRGQVHDQIMMGIITAIAVDVQVGCGEVPWRCRSAFFKGWGLNARMTACTQFSRATRLIRSAGSE